MEAYEVIYLAGAVWRRTGRHPRTITPEDLAIEAALLKSESYAKRRARRKNKAATCFGCGNGQGLRLITRMRERAGKLVPAAVLWCGGC